MVSAGPNLDRESAPDAVVAPGSTRSSPSDAAADDERRVVVIGSGPAGATAALALIEQGIPVTLLESGLRMPPGLLVRAMGRNVFRRRPVMRDDERNAHVASGDPSTQWYNALVPGGLSNYWTGAVPRFAPEDFLDGERLHARYRWPVTYSDLEPHYERVERLLGVVAAGEAVPHLPASLVSQKRRLPADWAAVATHARARGHGLTPMPLADVRPWLLTRSGAAFNSFTRIIPRLRRSPSFRLMLGAHALRLEWSGAQRRVTGIIYWDRNASVERRVRCAAAVVAGGPLASTKLLLDSACNDFPTGLGDTDGVLGRYLHDHPYDVCYLETDGALSRLGHPAYLTRGPYDAGPPLLAAGCSIGNSTSTADKLLSLTPLKSKTFGVIVFGTIVPTAENRVSLHAERRDEFGLPVLDIAMRFDAAAVENLVAARQRLLDILEAAGHHGKLLSAIEHFAPGQSVHYGGTVRMHQSPQYGVLDGWNRLHAVPNVVVADASAFTTGVEKNPTVTLMALADRAARRLAGDIKAAAGSTEGQQRGAG
jgi:choline dehydrogenase-like flavoprotein